MTWAFSSVAQEQRNREVAAATLRLRMLMEMPSESSALSAGNNNRAAALRGGPGTGSALSGPSAEYSPAEVLALQQSRFGLGDRRTLDQAIAFSGIDTKHRVMTGNRCGNLDYVPFTEHPWGAEYVPKYDAISESFLDVRDPGSIYFDTRNEEMKGAWERADKLYREGGNHLPHVAMEPTKQNLVDEIASAASTENALKSVLFSIPVREAYRLSITLR